MEKCRLCGTPQEKFPKSHIIPEFMYKDIKNAKSQIFRMRMPYGDRLKPILTGYYEKPLLCTECEKKIGLWESYAEKVLNGSTHFQMPVVSKTKDDLIQSVTGIDYTSFKLFLLSIIWRASVTNQPFFKEVSLGKEHEDRIAKMMLDGYPGEEDVYPITLIVPKGPIGKNLSIGQPYKNKTSTNAVRYLFPIAEIIYIYHISKHGLEEINNLTAIKKNNTMKIIFWPISRLNAFLELYQVKKQYAQKLRVYTLIGDVE